MEDMEPIHLAVQSGDLQKVRSILQQNPKCVNDPTKDSGETPLHLAAAGGWKALVELLLQSGANINAESFYHYTPLSSAIRTGHAEIAQLLILHGGEEYD